MSRILSKLSKAKRERGSKRKWNSTSSSSSSSALAAVDMEIIIPEPKLCVCVSTDVDVSYPDTIYHLKAIPLLDLFNPAETSSHKEEQENVCSWKDNGLMGMGFLGSNGSLYVLSTAWAVESFTINMSIFDMIPNMKSLEIQHKMVTTDTLPCFKLVYPLIVEIDSVIYVIAASFYGVPNTNVPPLVFKSYNLGNNEWADLDLPPFMSDPKLYPRFRISYVVVEDKLCISNFAFSCAFDTKTGEWGACNLFKGLIQFDKIAVPRAIMQDVKKCCGPPLPFKKQGLVLFNKFLIYTNRCYDVVARKIDKYGKLSKDCQTVFDGNHVELSGTDNNSMLVGLGEGSFCLLTHVPYNEYNDQTSELRFFKFKVSMDGNGESLTFNHDDVQISTFTPRQGETWQEVLSFFAC